jgi:hypothetical protein
MFQNHFAFATLLLSGMGLLVGAILLCAFLPLEAGNYNSKTVPLFVGAVGCGLVALLINHDTNQRRKKGEQ